MDANNRVVKKVLGEREREKQTIFSLLIKCHITYYCKNKLISFDNNHINLWQNPIEAAEAFFPIF